jgi:ankyrin repeat protein
MRRDERLVAALLGHGADASAPLQTWTPTRRSSADWNFEPPLIGGTPFWLAARFLQPNVMRLLVKHGADPLVVHRVDWIADEGGFGGKPRTAATTALMAALGMGGRVFPWVAPPPREREALTLETVKLAAELGVDVNVADTDGRTALDAAKTLKFESVVDFLVEKGAKPGTARPQVPAAKPSR